MIIKKSRRSRRLLFLILILTALFCLCQCSSDDNGGGGDGADKPASAIYIWRTGCEVLGDMNAPAGGTPCMVGTGEGTARADSICQARYSMDKGSASGNRHKALLAAEDDEGGLPQEFPIPGKDTVKIYRSDGRYHC